MMLLQNEILSEIYTFREEHAQAFNYDLQAICDDLQKKQSISDRKIISTPLKAPNRTPISIAA